MWEARKEAFLGVLGDDDFFGEGCLAGQLVRMSSAIAMTDCVLLHVDKKAMLQAMSLEPKFSATFVKRFLTTWSISFSTPASNWSEW